MSRSLTLLTAAALAAFSIPATAQLAANCGNRGAIIEYLRTNFSEEKVASGYTTNGMLIELFVSSRDEVAGNTFTVAVTSAGSLQSCVIVGGSSWTRTPAGRNPAGKNIGGKDG
jgi:hypothetical protein